MFIREKYFAPENEGGAEQVEEVVEALENNESQEQQEQQPKTLRQQLEGSIEAIREGDQGTTPQKGGKKSGYTSRARQAAAEDAEAEGQEQQQQQAATPAPDSLTKEQKAEWAKWPKAAQDTIIKREQDVAKGVQELKSKYAEIDAAIAPHMEAIRRHNQTPAAAINQLFGWFQALAANPQIAFPALAKSFGYELSQFVQQQQQNQQQQEQQQAELTPEQRAMSAIEQRLAQMEQTFAQQLNHVAANFDQRDQARTNEILENWAKGKEDFQEVRQIMAQLIASGAVPLQNGQVDLDGAYDRARWMHPEIRGRLLAKIEADKQAEIDKKTKAEAAARAAAAEKARKAGVGVGGGAPGAQGGAAPAKGGKRKSVRESIEEARQELSGS